MKRLPTWASILIFVVILVLFGRLAYDAGFAAGSSMTDTTSGRETS